MGLHCQNMPKNTFEQSNSEQKISEGNFLPKTSNGVNRSDQQLVSDYLSGDEKLLEVLFGRYLKPIYSFIYRYVGGGQDAEDVTQEAFVKAWRNLKKFDQKKSFKTWIFSIAKNAAIDFLKKKKAIPFSEFENEEGENIITETLSDPSPLPHELLEKAGIAEMLNATMEKLSPKYRMVLFLRYNDHFTFREIAEIFGESVNTVKSRHQRALVKLREILKVEEN
jgi:RNA polymerase sigma-70 factor (ECF subfamily)